MESDEEVNYHLPEVFRQASLNARTVAVVTEEIRNYFNQLHTHDPDTLYSEPWLFKPELPSSDEIFGSDGEFVDLEPNKIDGPWASKDTYLKAHYELLREEAVAPLRDAVAIFRSDPDMSDDKYVAVYEKVYVTGMTFARRGLAFKVQFSTNRAGRNIVWDHSKRLVSGSVVALSPADDAFRTKCVIAVIAARPLDGVKRLPPEVDIFFANPSDADFDPQLEWIMVEAKQGYYEASRHVMTALQKLSHERFPLSEHICSLKPHVDAPDYVKTHPVVEMDSAVSDKGVKVDVLRNWPQSPPRDLDTTQWAALEQMLTKKLAIIQGPPGTGKTYVSVLALRNMLSNMKPDDSPIIVASQTNHALDQILTHISHFEKQYIRLGARSSDPEIKKRTLYNVRRDEGTPNFPGGTLGNAFKTSRKLFNAISEILQPFKEVNSGQPLPSTLFKQYGLLKLEQYESLEKGAKRWVVVGEEQDEADPIVTWLGDQAVPFQVKYTNEDFGFAGDEADLEHEQLKELEAEQGLSDDDEYEALRGTLMLLREGYQGSDSFSNIETGRCDYLDYDDMWRIPLRARGWVYTKLRAQLKRKILRDFRQLLTEYTENCKNMQIGAWERDHIILQSAKILGMTTTGLSKYRALISSMKPRIVLIEEAAEAIEGPIAAACLDSLQQLILVGDHQQLRGHCSVQDLEGDPFYLDISMFERLVKNGLKYVTLQRQRRMVPEIHHESVNEREEVPGMGSIRSFFFSHDWLESFDDMSSKYNEKEAEMVVEFFVYLVLNNVPVDHITVLTFYNGQRKKILKLMRNHTYLQGHYVKVVTVDSYQGEENEIVILSLVRNGRQGIGFLSIANRVCVALSRARRGFYMFGNRDLLASNELWAQVLYVLENKNPEPRIGHQLPLACVKHKVKRFVKDPSDWRNTNGGCEQACGGKLNCGHPCLLTCHSFSHRMVRCDQICNQKMSCKHICETPCATTHTCYCDCEESVRAKSLAHGQQQFSTADDQGVPSVGNIWDSKQQDAIKKFQEYANGESKEHDAILEQLAELQRRKEELERGFHPVEAPVLGTNGHSTTDSDAQAGRLKAESRSPAKPSVQPPEEIDLIEF
ncbi:P-loop containing nucleoside triphosphate hydrolase protein [Aspergillus spinulosporus]